MRRFTGVRTFRQAHLLLFLIATAFLSDGMLRADEGLSVPGKREIGFGNPRTDGLIEQVVAVSTGPETGVYFGGDFKHIDGQYLPSLARFDGAKWHEVGDGCPCKVSSILVDTAIDPPVIYVAGKAYVGDKSIVAEYRNQRWRTIAEGVRGVNERINAMTVYPFKNARHLAIGGWFTEVRITDSDKLPKPDEIGIAAFDGKSWSTLESVMGNRDQSKPDTGKSIVAPSVLFALLPMMESGRSVLYAGGTFRIPGGKKWSGIGRWDGTAWHSEEGMEGKVQSLCFYDDGSGATIYAGGVLEYPKDFKSRSGVWRRTSDGWRPVGEGIKQTSSGVSVSSLMPFSFRGTNQLLAMGTFDQSGDTKLFNIGAWNGKQWAIPDWMPSEQREEKPFRLSSVVAFNDAIYLNGAFRDFKIPRAKNSPRSNTASVSSGTQTVSQTPNIPATKLVDLKYKVIEIIPPGKLSDSNFRFAGLSNTGRVAVATVSKIPVSEDVASPLLDDNPFKKPQGFSKDPHLMRERIQLWDQKLPDKTTTLPGGEPTYSWPHVSISSNGNHLVGVELGTLGFRRSNRWDGTRWQAVPVKTNQSLAIFGVNDSGVMVGSTTITDIKVVSGAIAIREGKQQILTSPTPNAIAWAVSNSGLIAGQATDKFAISQACLWKDDKITFLGTLGGKWSIAYAVNDSGMVVGMSHTSQGGEEAFVWQNGQMRRVHETLKTSIASSVNNVGIIVGRKYTPDEHGFIASGSQIHSLDDLLIKGTGWSVKNAISINDQNCVLAIAEKNFKPFLVLLVPE